MAVCSSSSSPLKPDDTKGSFPQQDAFGVPIKSARSEAETLYNVLYGLHHIEPSRRECRFVGAVGRSPTCSPRWGILRDCRGTATGGALRISVCAVEQIYGFYLEPRSVSQRAVQRGP